MKAALACALALLPLVAAAEPGAVRGGEPAVVRHVAEDDAVRVDQLTVRGEVRNVTVTPKTPGFKPYEVQPGSAGRDPRDGAGQRVWRILSF